jgi:hypothetical protein
MRSLPYAAKCKARCEARSETVYTIGMLSDVENLKRSAAGSSGLFKERRRLSNRKKSIRTQKSADLSTIFISWKA